MGTYLFFGFLGAVSALFTFYLQKLGCTSVVASCVVGLLGAAIGHFTGNNTIALVVFAGSFVGMASISNGSIPILLAAGALSGLGVEVLQNIFKGTGGKLGAIAFIASLLVAYGFAFIKKILS